MTDNMSHRWLKKIAVSEEGTKESSSVKQSIASTSDKHACYARSVQNPSKEVHNLLSMYNIVQHESYHRHDDVAKDHLMSSLTSEVDNFLYANENNQVDDDDENEHINLQRKKKPWKLREDFSGTAILCHEWVLRGRQYVAHAVDLDDQVLEYAKKAAMEKGVDKDRMKYYLGDVLDVHEHSMDIITALNYGICYFHGFYDLQRYMNVCWNRLAPDGIFVCDVFGGLAYLKGTVRTSRPIDNFQYTFEQKEFDILTHRIKCFIHFKFVDGSSIKSAFHYDFRMWTLCEVLEAMFMTGYASCHIWIAESIKQAEDEYIAEYERIDFWRNQEREGVTFNKKWKTSKPYQDLHIERMSSWNAYVIGKK